MGNKPTKPKESNETDTTNVNQTKNGDSSSEELIAQEFKLLRPNVIQRMIEFWVNDDRYPLDVIQLICKYYLENDYWIYCGGNMRIHDFGREILNIGVKKNLENGIFSWPRSSGFAYRTCNSGKHYWKIKTSDEHSYTYAIGFTTSDFKFTQDRANKWYINHKNSIGLYSDRQVWVKGKLLSKFKSIPMGRHCIVLLCLNLDDKYIEIQLMVPQPKPKEKEKDKEKEEEDNEQYIKDEDGTSDDIDDINGINDGDINNGAVDTNESNKKAVENSNDNNEKDKDKDKDEENDHEKEKEKEKEKEEIIYVNKMQAKFLLSDVGLDEDEEYRLACYLRTKNHCFTILDYQINKPFQEWKLYSDDDNAVSNK